MLWLLMCVVKMMVYINYWWLMVVHLKTFTLYFLLLFFQQLNNLLLNVLQYTHTHTSILQVSFIAFFQGECHDLAKGSIYILHCKHYCCQ